MDEEGVLRRKIRPWLNDLGIKANDLKIFIQSLTHRSFARQINVESRGNEQLEFLGDSILSFIITSYLYKNYGYFREGKLAKIRSILVNGRTLAKISKEIGVDRQVLLSENEESCQGRKKESILADALEAFIGALYIDQGIDFTEGWVLEKYEDKIEDRIKKPKISDYKTYLQEVVQADYSKLVRYKLEKSEGPDHDKTFYSAAVLNGKVIGKGKSKSKKMSEQVAAKDALEKLYDLDV
mgnify:CR=1 FL=1